MKEATVRMTTANRNRKGAVIVLVQDHRIVQKIVQGIVPKTEKERHQRTEINIEKKNGIVLDRKNATNTTRRNQNVRHRRTAIAQFQVQTL